MSGKKLPSHPNRTHRLPLIIVTQPPKFFLNKPIVKHNIVSYENLILCKFNNFPGDFIKFRRILYHFIIDTCKFGDESGNITFRIY